jgi:class 3 adenylate cyclase
VRIDREYSLGLPDVFADVRVQAPGKQPYFVEIKYGYPNEMLLGRLHRKYHVQTPRIQGASKVVVVVDRAGRLDWPRVVEELPRCLGSGLQLEIWDEATLFGLIRDRFGVQIDAITEENLLTIRDAIMHAKGRQAFGVDPQAEYIHDYLKSSLLWQFGFWRLRQLREKQGGGPRDVLPPGLYRGVVVLLADLCSFSSYVRDTPDEEVVRHSLTSFYSKARYQIINSGGLLYQFVGDEVVGLFGLPDQAQGYVQDALDTAQALVDIGNAVSSGWQRHIDRIQTSGGVHIGIAIGDLQIVPLAPFGRAHMGVVGDTINLAARLMTVAGPSEIVVSNNFFRGLPEKTQEQFKDIEPVEAKNMGRIRAWKLGRSSH